MDQLRARIKEEKAAGVVPCRASARHTSDVGNLMIGPARSSVTTRHAERYPGKRAEKTHPRRIEDDSAQRLTNDRMAFWQRTREPRWESESKASAQTTGSERVGQAFELPVQRSLQPATRRLTSIVDRTAVGEFTQTSLSTVAMPTYEGRQSSIPHADSRDGTAPTSQHSLILPIELKNRANQSPIGPHFLDRFSQPVV